MVVTARARAAALSAALSLASGPGWPQQSPELPIKPEPSAETEQPPFRKGKGPGHGNSYVARFEEDYEYLRDPTGAKDAFDPVKFIPLDAAGEAWLTLSGETRFRFDTADHRNFGIAPSASLVKTAGASPSFTPATGVSTTQLYKERYGLGGDLHLGPNFRLYAELYHGQQTGHDVGPAVPGSLRDELGLVNGFGEVYDSGEAGKTGLRAGRQEVFLGNDLQVRANLSTNLPSPVFDGVRAYREWRQARVDAFAFNLVSFGNGILQDRDIPHVNLWGVYATLDMPKLRAAGIDSRTTLDLFYLGWRASPFAVGKGGGVYDDRALLTGARIVAATGAGFVASQDHRHTVGLRYFGEIGAVDFDWQAAYQTGSYAGLQVDAFALNTDTGYTLHGLPGKPRLGVHLDGASGGADPVGRSLHTYQPMYPNTQYYAPNNEFAPTNFYDVAPRLSLHASETVKLDYYYSFLWRYSPSDAVYTGAPWPGGNGQNSYAVTALTRGRAIGQQSDLRLSWAITPHLLSLAEFGVFFPSAALRSAGARTTEFIDFNLTFRF